MIYQISDVMVLVHEAGRIFEFFQPQLMKSPNLAS